MNRDEAGSSNRVPDRHQHDANTVDLDRLPSSGSPAAQRPRGYKDVRITNVEEVIQTLDFLVWVELVMGYYMDNSILPFIVRALVQTSLIMPRLAPNMPDPYFAHLTFIIGGNAFCMITHFIMSPPTAGEATRGYLHGSLILDFVGQLGPTSKIHLLILDTFIFLLQFTVLAVVIKQKDLWNTPNLHPVPVNALDQSDTSTTALLPTRRHDAAEREQHCPPLLSAESQREDEPFTVMRRARSWQSQDLSASGQAVIIELFLWDSVRQSVNAYHYHMQTYAFAELTAFRAFLIHVTIPVELCTFVRNWGNFQAIFSPDYDIVSSYWCLGRSSDQDQSRHG
ncbi:DUF1746-domain-containing protein [Tothia fuscella]|uniref:DUF1746-domain-containing protein n=1 Tax=Tothia fuscella TaxID=1048955 RepID=A0A9P4NDL1_9PEZI|nr:DUF1746-domain-containing protein [Tothia fuscella]